MKRNEDHLAAELQMKRIIGLGSVVAFGVLAACGSSGNQAPAVAILANGCGQGRAADAAAADGSDSAADGGRLADGASSDALGDTSPTALGDASNAGTDFTFQPSNIDLDMIAQYASVAQDVTITTECDIGTDRVNPTGCGNGSPLTNGLTPVVVQQGAPSGLTSTVNLVVVQSLTVSAEIKVLGPVPLIIVSLSDVTFGAGGYLLANSAYVDNAAVGPGAGLGGAETLVGAGLGAGSPATGVLGGGGGSYCGIGGPAGGGSASSGYGTPEIRPLVAGSGGGGGFHSDTGGALGSGGGAIQIVAAGAIDMASGSYITASGEGGPGGVNNVCSSPGGAAGGGSGGSILLEASAATLAGALVANGGGGGGGGGAQGEDGWYTAPLSSVATPAAGGDTGAGGAGAMPNGAAGLPDTTPCSPLPNNVNGPNGGGGGGGVGRIRINTSAGKATTTGAMISPDPTTLCASEGLVRPPGSGP